MQVVNFGSDPQNFRFFISGLASNVQRSGAAKTVLTGPNVKEENSFSEPKRVKSNLYIYVHSWIDIGL